MKDHSEIRSLLLSSIEGKLDDEQERAVEDHVARCESCKRYFETMSAALLPSESPQRLSLSLDPYLPARVKAMVEQSVRENRPGVPAAFHWAFRGTAFVVAVALGILLGEKLARPTPVVTSQRVIAEYSEIFAIQGIDDRLQIVTQTSGGASK